MDNMQFDVHERFNRFKDWRPWSWSNEEQTWKLGSQNTLHVIQLDQTYSCTCDALVRGSKENSFSNDGAEEKEAQNDSV